jgi:serine/threonine-protein kinase
LKPANVMIGRDGRLKVVDFGIAKPSTQNTNSGKLKGKLAYMSPEQARGEPLDARSDVFSLGIVLFELITRTRLLPKMNDIDTLTFMGGTQDLPRPSERRADIPEGMEAIIVKAMQRRREDRYQSAREFQEALEGWLRASGKSVSSGELADYLRTLFAKRVHERRQLIEGALSADLTPSSAAHLQRLAQGEGSSSRSRTRATGSRGRGLVAGVVALSLVVGGLGVAVAKRAFASEDVPAEPAQGVAKNTVPVAPVAPVELKPSSLIIDTVPSGAVLVVDGEERGAAPVTLEGVKKGEHLVEAKLDGYAPATRNVMVERDGEKLKIEVALLMLPAPLPPEPAKNDPPPKKGGRSAPKKAVAANGKLSLKTTPWTQVFLGKKKLGDTPLIDFSLPAGKHTLRLVSPEAGTESSIEVEITANETTVKKLKL